MSDLMQTCNMDERTNEEKLLDNKIEALIYELCPNTSRAWIFDEGIPEKLRILIRNATLDDWVSVEDRLPKTTDTVMVSRGDTGYWWGRYDSLSKEWVAKYGNGWIEVQDITHWQPLPQPPKEDE